MIPELAHFNTFQSLASFFEARNIVLSLIKSRPSSFGTLESANNSKSDILLRSLKDLFFDDDRDGRETAPYYGVIETDSILRDALEYLNLAKKDFKATLTGLALLDPNSQREMMKIVKNPQRWPSRMDRYASDLGRLNINHVYRTYVITSAKPHKIQQTWSKNSKSIRKITKKEAVDRILSLENPLPEHLKIQYESLASLPDSASLAVVHEETPHVRTNIFFRGRREPLTVKSRLPIIIPKSEGRVFIDFLLPEDKVENGKKHQRSDILIHQTPVASSIHVYRYRDVHEPS